MMAAIEIDDLWKSFHVRGKSVEAVRGLNLQIEQGEIFGFLGPNGAGKTTTLRILATLLPPDQGKVNVSGYDLVRQAGLVRQCIGYVGQNGGADIMASGRENLLLQTRAYGMPKKAAQTRVQELIEQLELSSFANRAVRTYSGGQRRRLDLASGIAHKPKLLFLDEPTIGLDPQSRARLWEEVRKLRAEGTTIFLTTHYLEEADALCDRLAIIDGGKIVAEGTPEQLKKQIADDVITLHLTNQGSPLEEAEQLLNSQPFVHKIQIDGQKLQVYVERGEEVLVTLLHLLEEAGLAVQSIALTRPSLDDVFLRQTGRS
ncbi:MAG TPA: ATP-binding cassette domain-containing protein, partial [Ktedonobacteraceae bacterium]|nr:ATP-binding cassette domain-containing protein [Ktedonobacteraceae bacterium]